MFRVRPTVRTLDSDSRNAGSIPAPGSHAPTSRRGRRLPRAIGERAEALVSDNSTSIPARATTCPRAAQLTLAPARGAWPRAGIIQAPACCRMPVLSFQRSRMVRRPPVKRRPRRFDSYRWSSACADAHALAPSLGLGPPVTIPTAGARHARTRACADAARPERTASLVRRLARVRLPRAALARALPPARAACFALPRAHLPFQLDGRALAS